MMNNFIFPPGMIGIIGSIIAIYIPNKFIKIFSLIISLLILISAINVPHIQPIYHNSTKFQLTLFTPDNAYSYIFVMAFSLALLIGIIFNCGFKKFNKFEVIAAIFYASSAISFVTSGDFISYFIYNELMAVSAALIIFANNTFESKKAGILYLKTHFLAGTLLLASISFFYSTNAHVEFFNINFEPYDLLNNYSSHIPSILLLVSILANAAMPPFSSWLIRGYSAASPFGSVYLSAFTTKAAVFSLIKFFPSNQILIYLGLFMIIYGIIYAILENDIRKILSYSIINQVGFMITSIGIGTNHAIDGAALHAFCHIFYKLVLMMCAATVIHATNISKSSELGGLYKSMKLTCFFAIIGAAAISAFPFTSGYISKSIISYSAKTSELYIVWICLMVASAGVFLHAGIKFPWFVFFATPKQPLKASDPSKIVLVAFSLASFVCIIPGVKPGLIYELLPTNIINPDPINMKDIIHQLELLATSALAFFIFLPLLKRTDTITLDFDWLSRILLIKPRFYLTKTASIIDSFMGNFTSSIYNNINKLNSIKTLKNIQIIPTTIIVGLIYIFASILLKLL